MGNFNRGGGGGGFRPRNQDVQRYKAVCSNCGQNCEVPFRPTGEKPVYCNNCFGKMRNAGGGGAVRDDRGRGDRVPRHDFGGGEQRRDFNNDVIRQLEEVNTKLDRLIRAIEKPAQVAIPQYTAPTGTLKQAVKRATDSRKKK